ncbi:MAG: hypothetical protein AYL29_001630 [Candidatus Bathyarchaeota archaeon B24]|nr:MAG: hypothetical protein AYL29_001630 [Candidatus Bathyarchaeota archaeon B24]RLI26729.1 MAG: DegT/DnrJ/EryC1/StrS family aminotransferase [Candidatus Bathyarchaeota archaeon]
MPKLAIRGGKPVRDRPYPKWPIFDERELEALKEVLYSGLWGIGGSKKPEFEKKFAEYQHAKYGVAVTNGTAALMIALKACGVGCGDEVIIPPYTFMATATAVLDVNAIPVFVDIEPDTYNIDPKKVEEAITDKTKAIIPVHIGGRPADMDALTRIADKYGLSIIEDACQAWGSEWRGQRVGAIGALGAFSFQSSKNITSGEGGIIVTNDEELYQKAWSLHNCGRKLKGEWYMHYLPGGNFRMTEFQAAILLVQLSRYDEYLKRRMENAAYLDAKLSKIDGLRPMRRDERVTRCSYHLYIMRYDPEAFGGLPKNKLAEAMRAEGIPLSPGYSRPLYREPYLSYYAKCPLSCPYYGKKVDYSKLKLPVTERACYVEGVWLPQYVLLGSKDDMDDIVAAFEKIKDNINELT